MASVLDAIKNSSKGRLDYDRHWNEQGRTKEILDEVTIQLHALPAQLTVTVPKVTLGSATNGTDKVDKAPDSSRSRLEINEDVPTWLPEIEISKYENKLRTDVQSRVSKYSQELSKRMKQTDEELDEEMRLIRQKHLVRLLKRMRAYEDEIRLTFEDLNRQKMVSTSKRDAVANKLKEIESRHKKVLAEKEQKATSERTAAIKKIQSEAEHEMSVLSQMMDDAVKADATGKVAHLAKHHQNTALGYFNNIDLLLTKSLLSVDDVKNAESCLTDIITIRDTASKEIQAAKSAEAALAKIEAAKTAAAPAPVTKKPEETPTVEISVPKQNSKEIDTAAFKVYLWHRNYLNEFEKSLDDFLKNTSFKRYRTDLQLFIRTNINTISNSTMDRLRDNIRRVANLFSGKSVEFQDKHVNANGHPSALNFCMYWAARTFMSVTSKQVLSVPKAAFPMAAVIVALWSRFPVFGKLLLANFYEKCPYVAPYYPSRDNSDSETSYLVSCGYDLSEDSGTVESEESFLNRMRAFVRLYGAIVQTNKDHGHPHGIQNGWMFLARLMNMDPKPNITAAVMHAFLSTCSHKMLANYGKQFVKMIFVLKTEYVRKIQCLSGPDSKKQAVVQLQIYLDNLEKQLLSRRGLTEPEGVIKFIPDC